MLKLFFVLISIMISIVHSQKLFSQVVDGEIQIEGIKRTYHLAIPTTSNSKTKLPLVIVLHGGGGSGANMIRLTNFNSLAEEDTFLAVFPDGLNKGWNDGRIDETFERKYDDVNFISLLIDHLVETHNADRNKIFLTGISNGAIFSLYLAYQLPGKIRAIAPVCGSIPVDYANGYSIALNTSVLIINGTADSLVKYGGGSIASKKGERGKVISTDSMINILMRPYTCRAKLITQEFPDVSIKDHSHALKYIYPSCGFPSQIILIKVIGGGHTWPGGVQYLPKFLVGNTCRDFNASSEIWKFFSEQK
ncbi:MAG: hypothetical protein LH473_07640 [Chitinophagales bacterium]|nr:hypothetical protein [Chitinophagales bacterium]